MSFVFECFFLVFLLVDLALFFELKGSSGPASAAPESSGWWSTAWWPRLRSPRTRPSGVETVLFRIFSMLFQPFFNRFSTVFNGFQWFSMVFKVFPTAFHVYSCYFYCYLLREAVEQVVACFVSEGASMETATARSTGNH